MKFCFFYIVLATIIAGVAAASISECKKDVNDIGPLVATLDNAILRVPESGISLSEGLEIQKGVNNLQKEFDKATVDFRGTSFSNADSKAILNSYNNSHQVYLHLLKIIVDKKDSIVKIPIPGAATLVHGALANLHTGTDRFFDAWVASSSNDVKPQCRSLKAQTDTAFNKALAAYS